MAPAAGLATMFFHLYAPPLLLSSLTVRCVSVVVKALSPVMVAKVFSRFWGHPARMAESILPYDGLHRGNTYIDLAKHE